jgi:TrmH family RNA methyltransferase
LGHTLVPLTGAKIRELRDLSRRKGRDASGHFVVDGVRGVREALRRRCVVRQITALEMDRISDTVTAQGILAVVQQKRWVLAEVLRKAEASAVMVALDAVADPGNVGAIIRACDWFGVDALVVGRHSVDIGNPKVVRSTAGSIFHLPILVDVDIPSMLVPAREAGYTVYATTPDSTVYTDDVEFRPKVLLVLGNEAWGVSEAVLDASDVQLAIRRHGSAESLNVSVACGVFLASIRKRR